MIDNFPSKPRRSERGIISISNTSESAFLAVVLTVWPSCLAQLLPLCFNNSLFNIAGGIIGTGTVRTLVVGRHLIRSVARPYLQADNVMTTFCMESSHSRIREHQLGLGHFRNSPSRIYMFRTQDSGRAGHEGLKRSKFRKGVKSGEKK